MRSPVLGVVSHVQRAEAAAPVLRALFDRCHVVAWHPGLPVDAIFATSWRAPRLREATHEAGDRLVLWRDPVDPAPPEWSERAALVVATPDPAVDARHYRAIAPFMRERWRGRFGIDVPVEMPDGLSWRQQRTFLSLCPAVVATGTTALEALAFATPLVTDTPTARLLAGTDGIDMPRLRRRSGKCGHDGECARRGPSNSRGDRARRPAAGRGAPRPERRGGDASLKRWAGRRSESR